MQIRSKIIERGIYFLIKSYKNPLKRNEIVYIGCSKNDIFSRISDHTKKNWDFNYFKIKEISNSKDLLEIEKAYITKYAPKYNENGYGYGISPWSLMEIMKLLFLPLLIFYPFIQYIENKNKKLKLNKKFKHDNIWLRNKYWKEELSIRDIANLTDVSRQTIFNYIKRYKLQKNGWRYQLARILRKIIF